MKTTAKKIISNLKKRKNELTRGILRRVPQIVDIRLFHGIRRNQVEGGTIKKNKEKNTRTERDREKGKKAEVEEEAERKYNQTTKNKGVVVVVVLVR